MPEESKAQKLAAAKKKLKEYQKRSTDAATAAVVLPAAATEVATGAAPPVHEQQYVTVAGSVSSVSTDISERSESEADLNGHEAVAAAMNGQDTPITPTSDCATGAQNSSSGGEEPPVKAEFATAASYFSAVPGTSANSDAFLVQPFVAPPTFTPPTVAPPTVTPPTVAPPTFTPPTVAPPTVAPPTVTPPPTTMPVPNLIEQQQQQTPQVNAMQVLIAEQALLTAELSKLRNACREKDYELEELRAQHSGSSQRLDELQQRYATQQQAAEQLRQSNAELQHKLAQASASDEEHVAHMAELSQQLGVAQTRAAELEQQHKTALNELEMAQLRIRQVSDEASVTIDNRVETLTQTQFMYEQQIRDLQAMVQQLTLDKEAANGQYQNYVQHLSAELAKLNEQHTEALDECAKLQERERQLIDHVGGLEREIQRSISRRAEEEAQRKECEQQKQASSSSAPVENAATEVAALQEYLSDFELERHEFKLKIKSQEDRLHAVNAQLEVQRNEAEELREQLARVAEEQPDTGKLLAAMESDKVAASRALTQNGELKQQLDELESRFVQLTNDKADLMVRLDAETYANREMRSQNAAMEERLRNGDERFRFKDEEMIRLSHENVELARKNLVLQQQVDRLQHYEVNEYSEKYEKTIEYGHDHPHDHSHDHQHDHSNEHSSDHYHADDRNHGEANDHDYNERSALSSPSLADDSCQEAHEETTVIDTQDPLSASCSALPKHSHTRHLRTAEAVAKLEQRFTQLMSQVADLTDEKQRLEHLVLQLQSETETIGEYIALYQTQRRMLKQREYEKAAQMRLLQVEREQLREKITRLNVLVSSLGVELPAALAHSEQQPVEDEASQLNSHQKNSEAEDAVAYNEEKLHALESHDILTKIQTIISEIKENTLEAVPTVTHTIDHLNCCLGKIDVV